MHFIGIKRACDIMSERTLWKYPILPGALYHCFEVRGHSICIPFKSTPDKETATDQAFIVAIYRKWM